MYKIATKNSIETNNYSLTLSYKQKSLQLLPENPLLLVPLTNIEIHQKKLDDTKQNTHHTLEILHQFEHPLSFNEKE